MPKQSTRRITRHTQVGIGEKRNIHSLEIRRKMIHVLMGITMISLIKLELINAWIMFFLIIFGMALSMVSRNIRIPIIAWFLDTFERPEARKRFPGKAVISFMAGSLLAIKLFPEPIALAAIAILTLGDAVSNVVGIHLGNIKNPLDKNKSLEGNLAGGIAGALGAMAFVEPYTALFASFGAMLVEAVQVKMNELIVDDNIIIPLAAGAIMLVIYSIGNFY